MKLRVLFLCTANSARSQMAEALLKKHGNDLFEVFSAGTAPEDVDPRTLLALDAFGLPSAGLTSKSVTDLQDQHFDYVISLCDKAHQECKTWPGSGVVMAWDFSDPKTSDQPGAFNKTLQEINERIRLFVLVNSKAAPATECLSPVKFYKCLADELRLKSLLLIQQEEELCVCELMAAFAEPQPKISRHLSQLRKCGLLIDRRQGQRVFYRLHPQLDSWMLTVLHKTRGSTADLLAVSQARLFAMEARPA